MIQLIKRTGFKYVLNGGLIIVMCLVVPMLVEESTGQPAPYGFWPDVGMVFGAVVACFGLGLMYSTRNKSLVIIPKSLNWHKDAIVHDVLNDAMQDEKSDRKNRL